MRYVWIAVVVGLTALPSMAANRVVNPDFDVDLAGWAGGTYAAFDVDGAPGEGSALLSNPVPLSGIVMEQPVAVAGNSALRLAGCVFIPVAQPAGYAEIGLNYYAGPCTPRGDYLGFGGADSIAERGSWQCVDESPLLVPATAGCAVVTLFVRNDASGDPVQAYFDAIFAPEPASGGVVIAFSVLAALARVRTYAAAGGRR